MNKRSRRAIVGRSLCVVLILFSISLFEMPGRSESLSPTISFERFRDMCGIHTSFIAARLCKESNISFESVYQAIPITPGMGTSLGYLRRFMEGVGLPCKAARVSASDIMDNPHCVFIVYRKSPADENAHFCVARSGTQGNIQIIDFPHSPTFVPVSMFKRSEALIVAPRGNTLPIIYTPLAGFALVLGGLGLTGSVWQISRKFSRKSPGHNQVQQSR